MALPLAHADVLLVEVGAYSEVIPVNRPSAARMVALCHSLANDLAELHERTGISLDNWDNARTFVEAFTGRPVIPNGA